MSENKTRSQRVHPVSRQSSPAVLSSVIEEQIAVSYSERVAERAPLFVGVMAADRSRIVATGGVSEFTRGQLLQLEGDCVRSVILLIKGIVKVTHPGPNGVVILRLNTAGDVLGAVDLFSTGKHATTVAALRSCAGLVWDAQDFLILLDRFPVLHQNMARLLGRHVVELTERFRELATEKVDSRLARQLVRLVKQVGRPRDGGLEIGLSREELAQMIGTTLFTVSRVLSAWGTRGIVRPRREAVIVCDLQSLRAICEVDERE